MHHPPLLRPIPPSFPAAPISIPTPVPPWSQTFPSLCIASSIQMSHVVRTATLQAVYIHRPSERILLRGLSRGRWSCPRRSQISRSSRASRRANPGTARISAPILHVYQSLVAWLYQAHNARIIMPHHMAQYMYAMHYMQICALNCH